MIAAALAVAALALAVFFLAREDNGTSTTGQLRAQRMAATQAACQRWRGTNMATSGPDASWCTSMTGWMSGQMSDGHMMSSMWGGPQGMTDACKKWAATGTTGASGGQSTEWCQQLATWMSEDMGGWHTSGDWDKHMGNWSGGMMGR